MDENFSRRKFIKATGGFVAGAASVGSIPLISKLVNDSDIISPAEAQAVSTVLAGLKPDKYIALENLRANRNPNFLFLNGITADGAVRLAPSINPPYSGTKWKVTEVSPGIVTLENLGANRNPNFLFLNGITADGAVRLAPSINPPYSGTKWKVTEVSPGIVTLENLGANRNPNFLFLNGITADGAVRLAPSINPLYSGTKWKVTDLGSVFRDKVVRIAYEQWEFFQQGALKERQERAWQQVGQYWQSVGLDYTGKDINQPWSAAFISWVMREAGAGNRFPYNASHSYYIVDAIEDRKRNDSSAAFFGYRLNEYSPKVGDLVGAGREPGVGYDSQPSYKSHVDIVVAIRPGKEYGEIDVIGGNVSDSVSLKTLKIDSQGKLIATNNQSSYPWFVVLSNQL